MGISNILKDLQSILPPESFFKEPESSLKELLYFEKKYSLNTTAFIQKKCGFIELEDSHKWLNAYENYLFFKGDVKKINTISTDFDNNTAMFLNNKDAIEYFSEKETANSYLEEFAVSFYSTVAIKW